MNFPNLQLPLTYTFNTTSFKSTKNKLQPHTKNISRMVRTFTITLGVVRNDRQSDGKYKADNQFIMTFLQREYCEINYKAWIFNILICNSDYQRNRVF